ncbi:MAG TPA: 3-deoxy-manno-octulosonate cytidylyltransferase [Steroidobacteraceae bacterium]|jgi:3-deoxy-manno-octulosonate cytidylyltransferase (CMP-KDO synthetase)|nr:3-deoxy-manno-octulosonate cytidylyltransferase [Steroidobacteraceae bacterium]
MFHVVIPARYAATRLPGKPLIDIGGRTLIEWVWRRAKDSSAKSVIIATDDARIAEAARGFGADCLMTSAAHASGTDRIAEVARKKGFARADVVVNLQGDEPLMPARIIDIMAEALDEHPGTDISTAVTPVRSLPEFLDPNCVKALRAQDGAALYFSRAPVPWPRDRVEEGRPVEFTGAWRHIGIYGYRAASLARFALLPATPLEQTEKLEQLRALENGMRIHLEPLAEAPPPGVDTPEDLERVRAVLGR